MIKRSFAFSFVLMTACALTIVLPVLHGQTAPATNDRLLQHELRQQQIRGVTQKVAEQIGAIIAEFQRNGLAGDDVEVLKSMHSIIDRLSATEMEKVINLLQAARNAEDPTATRRQVVDAYSGQKNIIVQLRHLLLEYQRQNALYQLSVRFNELAARQNANLREGVLLAGTIQGKLRERLDELQRISLQVQETEQQSLLDEVKPSLVKLQLLTKELDGAMAEHAKSAVQLAREGQLTNLIDAAVQDIRGAKLLSAAGSEKRARDLLRQLARLLAPAMDSAEVLRLALRELEQAIEQQKQVMALTRKTEGKNNELGQLENRQADLVDKTDLIREDVQNLAPTASEQLKSATDKMQEARAVLSDKEQNVNFKRSNAPLRQQDALANLEQARRTLQEQLAQAEEEKPLPTDALANLRQIQKEVRELIPKQEKVKQDSAAAEKKPAELPAQAPKQGELRDTAQDLQQRASPNAPAAAESLAEAANQMQKSQKSLAQSKNAPEAQQAALDALTKADRQLSEDIARLEQAAKELAALEDLLKKLITLIEDQQFENFDTAFSAAKSPPPGVKELAAEQRKLSQSTAELQQSATAPAPSAAAYLGSARAQMDAAKGKLDLADARGAQPPQAQALENLYLARKTLEDRINALKDLLGLPKDSPDALADAASVIQEAQQDVSQAMSQLPPNLPSLMESLQKQEQEIADALKKLDQSAPPISQAQQGAAQAAQQLGQSTLPAAISSMRQAQAGMKQAMQSGQQGSLPQLSELQAEVQKMAELLAAAGTKQAAQSLQNATKKIGPLAAGRMGQLPGGAQKPLQQAQSALTDASAQAEGNNAPGAQMSAEAAQQSLAQALAALALAQAGMNPGQGQGQGEGQGQGQGQGPGNGPGQGKGEIGNWNGPGGADGARRAAKGAGQFIGLPARDRAAIQQSQSERYPQEYGALIEQYLKNLSDEGTGEK